MFQGLTAGLEKAQCISSKDQNGPWLDGPVQQASQKTKWVRVHKQETRYGLSEKPLVTTDPVEWVSVVIEEHNPKDKLLTQTKLGCKS